MCGANVVQGEQAGLDTHLRMQMLFQHQHCMVHKAGESFKELPVVRGY